MGAGGAQATDTFWDSLDPFNQCRISALSRAPSDTVVPGAPTSTPSKRKRGAKWFHPDNPLFWFGAIGGVTVVAMAASTGTVGARAGAHVGPVAAEAEIGREGES